MELNIKDGHVKYKKLPQSFKNIELKLLVENKYPIKDSINIRLDIDLGVADVGLRVVLWVLVAHASDSSNLFAECKYEREKNFSETW